MITFKVVDNLPDTPNKSIVYLQNNKWDDWFEFETSYDAYFSQKGKLIFLGKVKIARRGQNERRAIVDDEFYCLPEDYFSLGASDNYYTRMKILEEREEILIALRDIAYNLDIFNSVASDRVTRISLLRDITHTMVKGQWHRMAIGGAPLTNYDFTYILPGVNMQTGENIKVSFNVDIKHRTPPSNIHVLIGKNGVGKTTILKRLIQALEGSGEANDVGEVITDWGENFSNIVNISFSAFDMPIFPDELGDNIPINYTFVGLIKKVGTNRSMKTSTQLADDFFDSIYRIIKGSKKRLWVEAIELLESDYTFKELNIKNWSEVQGKAISSDRQLITKEEGETDIDYLKRIDRENYAAKIKPEFERLSSGHKNILLTIATLIDLVEEKTLVILDEPEEHLHPPLVSRIYTCSFEFIKL